MFRRILEKTVRLKRSSFNICARAVHSKMELGEVVSRLNKFAPLSLAEKWDNVGLLVEPSGIHLVSSILLTNDLTEPVMEEACQKNVSMILSYHPPIFTPLKRLTSQTMKERIIIKALEKRIAVYSPHTAFDAVKGGVNDWLASGLGDGSVQPLQYSMACSYNGKYKLQVCVTAENFDALINTLNSTNGVISTIPSPIDYIDPNVDSLPLIIYCSGMDSLTECLSLLENFKACNTLRTEISHLEKLPLPGTGQGRLLHLNVPVGLEEMIIRIKKHLNLEHLRVAYGVSPPEFITTIAMCAGSGASVLKGVKADLYLTGEMSHHEVIDATSQGINVILCEHSNSERGFLREFSETLKNLLDGHVSVHVSVSDKDPLSVI